MTIPIMSSFLDEFPMNTFEDYRDLCHDQEKRFAFHRRIPIIAENEKKRILPLLDEYCGLKMHFHVERDKEVGWINIPNQTFAKKLAFFAGKVVISFPFHEFDYRKDEDVKALLNVILIPRLFIDKDIVNIIPSTENGSSLNVERFNRDYELIPANFNDRKLKRQFEERVINIKNLYLPVFKNINPADILAIREEEDLLYQGVENRLAHLFSWNMSEYKERMLLEELFQIDRNVRKLEAAFQSIQKACKKKNKDMLLGIVKTSLILLIPKGKELIDMVGKEFADELNELSTKAKGELSKDAAEYYLFWRIDCLNVEKEHLVNGSGSCN